MSTLELKAEIHKKIDALDNVSELIDLNLSLDWFMQEKLTDEEKTALERLNQAKKSAEEGTGILHDDVMKEAKQWLKR
ncbi:hypothetical protein [Runella slithyformis]|uniref:Uncharacterized protein n=1 Tax=Runella slithyformis (strain ATCC 29530 / DSM 19594 / LMG 11500 / NCIMB 11436 / LSU 4) TaxID=761193 RepID=A0A7U3ZL24_RUNSL|nr:hypothetical protein [Runella slithyformis]AEI49186.1 hypothetical protein Runsl_2793 [Runella slithyformis DSM 19594]